ncbi:hypothetical protein LIER_16201 [Lithospermum erythrorhizon]|uniref:Uncharacterized protein n=1 Tax=Lithospermum erythrorhizon TaxID=34254 RepID=A0AAV3Q8Y8_LITER
MASIPSSLEYTPSAKHVVVGDPMAIAESSFDRLEDDLGHDPDFPMMRAALENFYLIEFMDFALSQALRNRGWLTRVTRRVTIDAADHGHHDRGSVPQAERAASSLRVAFGSGLIRTLEA